MSLRPAKMRVNKANDQVIELTYPFDWRGLDDFSYPRDENGLPQVNLGRKVGLRYHPITIAQYGLFNLQEYVRNDEEHFLNVALRAANWLVDNIQDWKADIGAWIFDFDLGFYGTRAPWISGMAQGQGLSLLLRVHGLSPDEHILDVTRRAFEAFLHPVAEGGVVARFPDGGIAFEEFPTQPSSLVLNGNMFALLGIHDYASFWDNIAAKELFEAATAALKRNLHRYDTGFWNLYDLHPTRRLASHMYMKVHVQLLEIFSSLVREPFFGEYASRWGEYLRRPSCRATWASRKLMEKIRLRFKRDSDPVAC